METNSGTSAQFFNITKSVFGIYTESKIFAETDKGLPIELGTISELAEFALSLKPGQEIRILAQNEKELIEILPIFIVSGPTENKKPAIERKTIPVNLDPADKYISLMERQIDYLVELQERSEARLDQRLQTIVKALRPMQAERQSQPENNLNLNQLAEQIIPIIELIKKSGVIK